VPALVDRAEEARDAQHRADHAQQAQEADGVRERPASVDEHVGLVRGLHFGEAGEEADACNDAAAARDLGRSYETSGELS